MEKRRSRRSARSRIPKSSMVAAASSIARGMPSRRRQISTTIDASSSVKSTAARSTKSWTPGNDSASLAVLTPTVAGILNGARRYTHSAEARSGSRLVERTWTPPVPLKISAAALTEEILRGTGGGFNHMLASIEHEQHFLLLEK